MHLSIASWSLLMLAFCTVPHSTYAWTPTVDDRWNYNLETPVKVNVDVDVVFIDMDDDKSQRWINQLHKRGKAVVCYISIGSWEEWRDDAADFPDVAIGNGLEGWPDAKWLDVTNSEVRNIMEARVTKAAGMDCDGIEPDNMGVSFEQDTGVDISEKDLIEYNTWFAEIVHDAGMKVGLKNTLELVEQLADSFDFAINEECYQYTECGEYKKAFLDQGKPVFNVEYTYDEVMCDEANALGIATIIKIYAANRFFCSCADPSKLFTCTKHILNELDDE